jgi:hypothetical protein
MPPKKRLGERWLKLAPFEIVEEYETPTDDSYVPKEDILVAWSFSVVKAAQFKILLVLKVGTEESFTWAIVTGWEVSSVQAQGGHVDIILENSSQQTVHVFMQDVAQPFDPTYLREQCAEPELIKPEAIFIDGAASITKIATRFTKLKHAINAINKEAQSKSKSDVATRRKSTAEEGAGSSRPQTVKKPRPVPTDSRRTTPTATLADSEAPTPSQSRQTTPSKRQRKSSSAMTEESVSPELKIPKAGEEVEPEEITKINETFETKCLQYFFMGREFMFKVNISQCHLAPPEMCVRAKEDAYVEWLLTKMIADQFKFDKHTLVLIPQGHKKMPTPDMWDTIAKGDFWLIDGQHSVEAAKKLQTKTNWNDPNRLKEKVKVWDALVVWSDDETRLSDISRYFNKTNKLRPYRTSWIRNIMASREVWEFYERPKKERENAKAKNPKWEVRFPWHPIVSVARPKLLVFFFKFLLHISFVSGQSILLTNTHSVLLCSSSSTR